MDHVPAYEFQKGVARHRGDAHGRGFSCRDQYLAMAFAQLTYRESLRDVEACLRSMSVRMIEKARRKKAPLVHDTTLSRHDGLVPAMTSKTQPPEDLTRIFRI